MMNITYFRLKSLKSGKCKRLPIQIPIQKRYKKVCKIQRKLQRKIQDYARLVWNKCQKGEI